MMRIKNIYSQDPFFLFLLPSIDENSTELIHTCLPCRQEIRKRLKINVCARVFDLLSIEIA